jgi:hypothetical protein
MLGAMSSRRSAARQQTNSRRRAVALAVAIVVVVAVAIVVGHHDEQNRASTARRVLAGALSVIPRKAPEARRHGASGTGAGENLRPGSNPAVLPGPVLIADRDNNRLLEVSPDGRLLWRFPVSGDLAPGQTFLLPDDAFFSPNGPTAVKWW